MAAESVARIVPVAPTALAMVSGASCMSTAMISAAPARFATATIRLPIGPLPITITRFPSRSPACETACQATLAGSARAAARSCSPAGNGRSILAGSAEYLLKAPWVCGTRAALPR
jgi:hypothetical protein